MTTVKWIRDLQAESERLGLYDEKPVLSAWRYESDGDVGNRTHYAVRDAAYAPTGVERFDFPTKKKAVQFVKRSNALILRLLNT